MRPDSVPDAVLRAALTGAQTVRGAAGAEAAVARARIARVDGLADAERDRAVLVVLDELPPFPADDDLVEQHAWRVAAQDRALAAAAASEGGAAWRIGDLVTAVERLARARQERASRTWAAQDADRRREARLAARAEARWIAAAVDLGFDDVDLVRDYFQDDLAAAEREAAGQRRSNEAKAAAAHRASRRRALAIGAGLTLGALVGWSQRESGLPAVVALGSLSAVGVCSVTWALSDLLIDHGDDLRHGASLVTPVRALIS